MSTRSESGSLSDTVTKFFQNMGYLPRWSIFVIDVSILVVSHVIAFALIDHLISGNPDLTQNHQWTSLFLQFGVHIFAFIFFRTYSGVIRHSSFVDGLRLLMSISASTAILVSINAIAFTYLGHPIYLNSYLFLGGVLSFLNLFLLRVFVKYIFEIYANRQASKSLQRVLIYGSDANALSVANAIKAEVPKRFYLIGFMEKNESAVHKRLLNLPIHRHNRKIHVLLRSLKADALIISEKGMSKEETAELVEDCLEYNYKVYTVPSIADWEDKEKLSKQIKAFAIEDLLERKPIVLDMNTISNQIYGKHVLVTGAAGSIGSEIARQLIKYKPSKLILLDQAETPLHALNLEMMQTNSGQDVDVVTILADIRQVTQLEYIFATYQPEIVYHAAAYKHVPLMEGNPTQAVLTNVLGSKNVADLSLKYQVKRFVMVSTDKAVNPSNVMGASKRIAEKYVQALFFDAQKKDPNSTKYITTRFGNVLGSNGSIVPLFTKQIQEGGPLTLTHPDIIRYFMTIPEACQLVLEAGAMGKGGEIFIFDMGEPIRIIDLARKMIRLAGFTPGKEIEIKIIGLRPGEKLYEELLNDESATQPTHNEKIMISIDTFDDFEYIKTQVEELVEVNRKRDAHATVKQMKQMVPEFKSLNSEYEYLDEQPAEETF